MIRMSPSSVQPAVAAGIRFSAQAPDAWRRKLDLNLSRAHAQFEQQAQDAELSLFIRLKTPPTEALKQKLTDLGIRFYPIAGEIMTGRVKASQLEQLAKLDDVTSLQGSQRLHPNFR
jgi:hypothetical protein